MDEQLSRSRLFLGEAGQEALTKSFIVVVGLGGVGSHAAHMCFDPPPPPTRPSTRLSAPTVLNTSAVHPVLDPVTAHLTGPIAVIATLDLSTCLYEGWI